MKYNNVIPGKFISRPNRFIALVETNGTVETVHVKNTGRCKEILVPGCKVYLEESSSPSRKTKFDLIAAEKATVKGNILINIDSQAPNQLTYEWLKSGNLFSDKAIIKREVTYGKSRFDFYIEDNGRKIFLEVKGVTLENNNVLSFPDAPTERGCKHLNELIKCVNDGYESYILFVIQMHGAEIFRPNYINDPEFSKSLENAINKKVNVIAVECIVEPDKIEIHDFVPVDI